MVEAEVGAAKGMRTLLGARVVRVELSSEELVTAVLELRRKGKTFASKRFVAIRPGERLLSILVPRSATPGGAALRLVLSDAAGNQKGARRQVTLASPSARATASKG